MRENGYAKLCRWGRLGEIIRPAAIPGSPDFIHDLSGLADREIGRKESELYT
jgi:hypothetical protein